MTRVRVKTGELKRLMASKNKSQRWLAKRIKVSSGFMSQICNGRRCPSPTVRERIMSTLGIEAFEQLFQIEDSATVSMVGTPREGNDD